MTYTIQRAEDSNEQEREARNGRLYVSRRTRVVWVVRDAQGKYVEEFARLKDAKAAYPAACRLKPERHEP